MSALATAENFTFWATVIDGVVHQLECLQRLKEFSGGNSGSTVFSSFFKISPLIFQVIWDVSNLLFKALRSGKIPSIYQYPLTSNTVDAF